MRKLIFSITSCLFVLFTFELVAQKKPADATLFTYGGTAVGKNEFLRMYTKNINNTKPDFSDKAVREYLSLYGRFKMKVAEANRLKMDTLSSIQSDFVSYKKQLAKTYLTDKEVTERLVKESHERLKKDVRVAHILLNVSNTTDDSLGAFNRIDSLYKQITSNKADFAKLAEQFSDDKQSGKNGGDLGFFTAMQIVYPFENAAYNTPLNTVSKPFRTIYGYHIVKKLEERPARGEIQVAQILVQVSKSGGEEAKAAAKKKIDSIALALKKGAKFETLVEKHSDDKFSNNSEGVLQTFKVGEMVPAFENASFGLKKPGDIAEPISTDFGYHIIKLIKKIPLRPYDSMKNELTKKVEKDGRIEIARQQYIDKVKVKLNYIEDMNAVNQLIDAIPDSTMDNGTYKADTYSKMIKSVFSLDGNSFTQADFASYIETFTRGRIYGQKASTLRSLFKNYAEKVLYDVQENRLADENEEYKNLLEEYKDGIMLFELTDKTVWSRASTDTTGLQTYYENHKNKYQWAPAVTADLYRTIDEDAMKNLVKELSTLPRKSPEEIVKIVNGDGVQDKAVTESGKFEKTKFPANLNLVTGKYSSYYKNEDGSYGIVDVKEAFDQPTTKTLQEAKGYVISEYQDYLEKQWNQELETKYPLVINEATLKTIIK
jgi:peptidyl-prolyl cis-trans isomerase SurA